MIGVLDLVGTFTFAASGAISAARKRMDLFGVFFVAFVAALGGGSIRDALLGATPVFWLLEYEHLGAILLAALCVALFKAPVLRATRLFLLADAVGIGAFTVIGLTKGLAAGVLPPFAVLMGVLTSIAGGLLRDILCGDPPVVLRKEVYAVACLVGGAAWFPMESITGSTEAAGISTAAIIVAIRVLALRFGWNLPILHYPD
jgi:uncharacterized membrane protein YeiH